MSTLNRVLNLYVAPFLMGVCMAAAASSVGSSLAWIIAGIGFGYASLPAGRRMMARFTGELA